MLDVVKTHVPRQSRLCASRGEGTPVSGSRSGAEAHEIAERALEIAYRTALGITRDVQVAADVAQDVAIKAMHRASDLRNPDALGAWIHRTAVRAAIDECRTTRRRQAAEHGYGSQVPTSHLDEEIGTLLDLLANLPERQRAALALRYVHDLTDRQIAHALDCRTGTARSLLSRATAQLRDQLATTPPTKDVP